MTPLAAQARRRRPPKHGFFKTAHRIAGRFEPQIAAAFEEAVRKLQKQIDEQSLRNAVAGGNLSVIEAAAGSGLLQPALSGSRELESGLVLASTQTGDAAAYVLRGLSGVEFYFAATYPDVLLYARRQVGELVVAVGDDVKEAIRIVVAAGHKYGLTTEQQARAIRQIVGLPPNWANAPLNFADDLRNRRLSSALGRRLSATDKSHIRRILTSGEEITEDWIAGMQDVYSQRLLNRRALNIAGTESRRAAHAGQRAAWRQGVKAKALPANVRRVYIVTPDDRLRETHAQVPGLNPKGVGLEEPFQTPLGPREGPPIEPLCRCGEGLVFPGRKGVL